MKAIIKQIEGCSFIGKSDCNHYFAIDTPKEAFGFDAFLLNISGLFLRIGYPGL